MSLTYLFLQEIFFLSIEHWKGGGELDFKDSLSLSLPSFC